MVVTVTRMFLYKKEESNIDNIIYVIPFVPYALLQQAILVVLGFI
jgi:hypothetical protein